MRLRPRALAIALCFAAAAAGMTERAAGAADEAEPLVRAVEIYSELPPRELDEIERLVALEPGRELTDAAVRRTLTNLHATGLAARAELRTRPASPDGVVAMVIVRSNVIVERVLFVGDLGLREKILAAAVRQKAGQPLVESRILQGVFRLQDRLNEEGYLAAGVRVRVDFLDERETRAEVTYAVDSGVRATVGEVSFSGSIEPFSAQQLLAAMNVAEGKGYRLKTVRDDVERLRGWLIGQGYRSADVGAPEVSYDEESAEVTVSYRVDVGPKLVLSIEGATEKELRKNDLLPFLGPDGYDEALLLSARERIVDHFQRKGHYDVEVEVDQRLEDGQLRVSVVVRPGAVWQLESVDIVGNQAFDVERLRDLMATSPNSLLTFGRGRLVDSELAADVANIETYYALAGYTETEVEKPRIERRDSSLAVTLQIREGARQRIATLDLTGCEAIKCLLLAEALEERQLAYAGGPFHPLILEDSIDYIRARYRGLGYADVQASATTEWTESGTRVAVRIDILEGPQTVLDRVIVRGHQKTERRVVVRALDFDAGQPVSGTSILEGQRRLYRLGIFSEVDVRLAPADLGATTRDVVVRVTEGKTRRVSYGLGYDTEEGARGLLGFSNGNVFGRGFTLRTDVRVSQRDQRLRVAFDQPFLGRLDVPLTYTLFYSDERETSFDVRKLGARVEAVRERGRRRRFSLIYDYRIVEPTLTAALDDPADPSSLQRENQEVRVSSLIPNVLLDHRDDPLDASSGWTTFVQLQWAFPFLSTDEEFLKLFVQTTRYFSLGRAGVLVGSARAGSLLPLEGGIAADVSEARSVSISERFFAGGATSHRAYERDLLGIPGETLRGDDPVGGAQLLLFNLDYRFPIFGAVGGVVFFDAGNVWADSRDVALGELKKGVGVGVRYGSPIGPLRLEVGWKLDRLTGEDGVAYFLSIGNPF